MECEIFDTFGFLITRLVHAHRNMIRQKIHALGLHRGQPHVMFALQAHPGLSNSEMAQFLAITPATLTNKVKRMEKSGLVIRQRDPEDERVSRIYLTEQGSGLMEKLHQTMFEMENILLEGFSDPEIKILKNQISKVLQNIEKDNCQQG